MKRILFFFAILLIGSIKPTKANPADRPHISSQTPTDSTRLAELDRYWLKLAQTVKEGDFEGYKAGYHQDAVVVFASGENKTSVPIAKALASWEKGFNNTKEGKQKDEVEFRLSQRIGNETTAHETGIFCFKSIDGNGKVKGEYLIHFEMLLIKKDQGWYALMEYQKSAATQAEWEALK